jgi:diguanylate cyclase (GGDEF)-like protein
MAGVVALLGVANLLLPKGQTRTTVVLLAVATSAVLLALCVLVHLHPLPARLAHPVLAAICLVAAFDSMVHLHLAADARLSSNTMLVLVGGGAFLLDVWWFAGTAASVWLLWALAIASVPVPAGRLHWLLGMVGATLLGAVLGGMRRSGLDRMAVLVRQAERAAVEDDLTGLLNRRGLTLVGQQVVASARRAGNAVHCVFVDVDGLKEVNDRDGHLAGDRVLLAVAEAIRMSVRSGDAVARWGGDEFCIIGPGPGTAPIELEKRIVQRVNELPPEDVPGWLPRVSAGSAMLAPWDDGDLSALFDQADREMYRRRSLRRDAEVGHSRRRTD